MSVTPSELFCPTCVNQPLEKVTTLLGSVERCPNCHAFFTDPKTLAAYADDKAAFAEALREGNEFLLPTDRSCPRCGERLSNARLRRANVILTLCPSCHGIWTSYPILRRLSEPMERALHDQIDTALQSAISDATPGLAAKTQGPGLLAALFKGVGNIFHRVGELFEYKPTAADFEDEEEDAKPPLVKTARTAPRDVRPVEPPAAPPAPPTPAPVTVPAPAPEVIPVVPVEPPPEPALAVPEPAPAPAPVKDPLVEAEKKGKIKKPGSSEEKKGVLSRFAFWSKPADKRTPAQPPKPVTPEPEPIIPEPLPVPEPPVVTHPPEPEPIPEPLPEPEPEPVPEPEPEPIPEPEPEPQPPQRQELPPVVEPVAEEIPESVPALVPSISSSPEPAAPAVAPAALKKEKIKRPGADSFIVFLSRFLPLGSVGLYALSAYEFDFGEALLWVLSAWGISSLVKTFRRYPFESFADAKVAELSSRSLRGTLKGAPVRLVGKIDVQGKVPTQTCLFHDDSGSIALNRVSGLDVAPRLFGLSPSSLKLDGELVLLGWYRWEDEPFVEVYEARTPSTFRRSLVRGLRRFFPILVLIVCLFLLLEAE